MKFGEFLSSIFARAADRFRSLWTDTPPPAGKDKDKDKKQHPVMKLSALKPTQIAVGMKQVALKQKVFRDLEKSPKKLKEFINDRPIRVVLGPGGQAYLIDRHHHALAMQREGFDEAPVQVTADYSKLSTADFWKKMEEMKYVHPKDANGVTRPVSEIPATLDGLQDDPYRSLAGFARNEGAFDKDMTPFVEFSWADFFRTRIPKELVTSDFDKALKQAVKLARSDDAAHLPGYILPKKDKGQKPK